jgi:hypothetical protein
MPGVSASPQVVRFQIGVLALGVVGAVLLWGCWLIYGAKIGTNICEHYTYAVGGANDNLRAWCEGRSWQGWLGDCLAAATFCLLVSTMLAMWKPRRGWLAVGALLAPIAVWAGFALPQTLAGPDRTTAQPTAPPSSTLPAPTPSTPTGR